MFTCSSRSIQIIDFQGFLLIPEIKIAWKASLGNMDVSAQLMIR